MDGPVAICAKHGEFSLHTGCLQCSDNPNYRDIDHGRDDGAFDVCSPQPRDNTPLKPQYGCEAHDYLHGGAEALTYPASPPKLEVVVEGRPHMMVRGPDHGPVPDTVLFEIGNHSFHRNWTQKELEAYRLRLPVSRSARKKAPMAEGLLDYFPDALYDIARLSTIGNVQHNGDEPLHWARGKGGSNRDEMIRHTLESRTIDTDKVMHATKAAWRAIAEAQLAIEQYRANGGTYPPEE